MQVHFVVQELPAELTCCAQVVFYIAFVLWVGGSMLRAFKPVRLPVPINGRQAPPPISASAVSAE